jgi:aminoglycoside phosphotransferase (APT) family kinase protein
MNLDESITYLKSRMPHLDYSSAVACHNAGVGTDSVIINNDLIALINNGSGNFTASKTAKICDAMRPFVSLRMPELVQSYDKAVVFKYIDGKPLMRTWLVRQTDEVQQGIADQVAEFMNEIQGVSIDAVAGVQLYDYSTNINDYKKEYEEIKNIVFPELLPSSISWARDQCENFLERPSFDDSMVFVHGDLTPWHILTDTNICAVKGIIDFGSGGIGCRSIDLSYLLLLYGERFVKRIGERYTYYNTSIDTARFMAGLMYLRWIKIGIASNDRKWLLHHLGCAIDLLPPR